MCLRKKSAIGPPSHRDANICPCWEIIFSFKIQAINFILTNAKKQRIKKTLHETAQCEISDENSIVRLRELAKTLKCTSYRSLLDMEKLCDFSATLSSRHLSLVMP